MGPWVALLMVLWAGVEGQSLEEVQATQGRTAIMICTVSVHGAFTVTWTDPSSRIIAIGNDIRTTDPRFSVTEPYPREHQLKIRQVHATDAGEYTCSLGTTPPVEKRFKLIVTHPPAFNSKPAKDITVRVRDNLSLLCNASGSPIPTVTWYKKHPEPGGKDQKILEGQKIVLSNVSRADTGQYECVADNGIPPPARHITTVHVQFPPSVEALYQRIIQPLGRDTLLQCKVAANPVTRWYWQRDGATIKDSAKHSISLSDVQQNTKILGLFIRQLTEADFTSYRCVAGNDMGTAQAVITLIKSKLTDTIVTDIPKNTASHVGSSAQFNCSVASLAQDSHVVWWRDLEDGSSHQVFHSQSPPGAGDQRTSSKYTVLGHYNLMVHNVVMEDAGRYRCEITKHANHSAQLSVFDHAVCTGDATVWSGDLAPLSCSVAFSGPSIPILVTWSHGQRRLSSVDYDKEGLIRRNVSFPAYQKDAGLYTCHAYSQMHPISTQCTVRLVVNAKIVLPGSASPVCDEDQAVSMRTLTIILAAGFGALILVFAVILWLVVSCLRNSHRVEEKRREEATNQWYSNQQLREVRTIRSQRGDHQANGPRPGQ